MLFGEVNFAIIANRYMGNFVTFWHFFGLSICISTNIELLITENIYFMRTFHIKLVSFKNLVRTSKYGHMVFAS